MMRAPDDAEPALAPALAEHRPSRQWTVADEGTKPRPGGSRGFHGLETPLHETLADERLVEGEGIMLHARSDSHKPDAAPATAKAPKRAGFR